MTTSETEHAALRSIMQEVAKIMDDAVPGRIESLSRERLAFARAMRQFIKSEQQMMQTCLAMEDAHLGRLVQVYYTALNQLYIDYSRHVHEWRSGRVIDEWETYRRSIYDLKLRLLALLRGKEREILPRLRGVCRDPKG